MGLFIAFVIDMVIGAMLYIDVKERQNIVTGIEKIAKGDFAYQIKQENLHGDNLVLAKSVNSIGNGIKNAVEVSMKDERMKADLITNVSHDIKTPLTMTKAMNNPNNAGNSVKSPNISISRLNARKMKYGTHVLTTMLPLSYTSRIRSAHLCTIRFK